METITLKSHVGKDGILKLEVPVHAADVDVDVSMTVQPVEAKDEKGWPLGYFERTFGCIKDKSFVRPGQGEYETRIPLE